MPTLNDYSPADVLAKLLIDVGLATGRTTSGGDAGAWPVTAGSELDSPDSVITIYDTEGVGGVRDFITGKPDGPEGFQVRVRSSTRRLAWSKAKAIYDYLAETLYRRGVNLEEDRYYLVHSCDLFGNIVDLGKDASSRRSIVVFNAVVNITDQTPTP
jgi:hypothetical protein